MIGATLIGQRVLSGIQDTLQIYQCYLGTPGQVRLCVPENAILFIIAPHCLHLWEHLPVQAKFLGCMWEPSSFCLLHLIAQQKKHSTYKCQTCIHM